MVNEQVSKVDFPNTWAVTGAEMLPRQESEKNQNHMVRMSTAGSSVCPLVPLRSDTSFLDPQKT